MSRPESCHNQLQELCSLVCIQIQKRLAAEKLPGSGIEEIQILLAKHLQSLENLVRDSVLLQSPITRISVRGRDQRIAERRDKLLAVHGGSIGEIRAFAQQRLGQNADSDGPSASLLRISGATNFVPPLKFLASASVAYARFQFATYIRLFAYRSSNVFWEYFAPSAPRNARGICNRIAGN